MSYDRDRGEFVEVMRNEGAPEAVALAVLRDAQRLHTLAEHQCGGDGSGSGPYGEPTERQLAAWDRAEAAAEARIVERVKPHGIEANFQGDPRGAVVKLRLPSGRHNDFGGEGFFCVPTRY